MRFLWATALSFNFIRQTKLDIQRTDDLGLFFIILGGLLTFPFVTYCAVIGLQEIKEQQKNPGMGVLLGGLALYFFNTSIKKK